jgi:hypothetical protein
MDWPGYGYSPGSKGPEKKRNRNPETVEQNSVVDLHGIISKNPNMLVVATDLTMLPSAEQAKLAELCFNLIGLWSEWADVVTPDHPLWNEYQTSKRMVEGLFENVNSGGKHRASA